MRIALFFWGLQLGGVEHMMVKLSQGLTEVGHDVTLILARPTEKNEYEVAPNVNIVRLNSYSTPKVIYKLSRHLSANRYDAIFTGMPTTNIALILAGIFSFRKQRIIISERSNPQMEAAHSKTIRYRLAFTLQPYLYPRATAIVAVCHDLAAALSDFARIPRHRIRVIYNPAVRADEIEGRETTDLIQRNKVEGPLFITAGRLMPQKDYETLICAFKSYANCHPGRLLILGEGPEREKLTQLIDKLMLRNRVELLGQVADVMPWLRSADVFVLSSKWEGFGNVLAQALAAGCKIVSTDCKNGPREILDDGRHGILVPVGDVEAMAKAMFDATVLPVDPEGQRERARDFSAERSIAKYVDLFEQVQDPS